MELDTEKTLSHEIRECKPSERLYKLVRCGMILKELPMSKAEVHSNRTSHHISETLKGKRPSARLVAWMKEFADPLSEYTIPQWNIDDKLEKAA